MEDKMDLQEHVGLSESNKNVNKISSETTVTTVDESRACTETDGFGTILVEEKLCSRMEDEMSFQQSVGLNESTANDEKISDETNVTTMGESETCVETDILRTEEAEEKLCSRMEDKMDLPEHFGLSVSNKNVNSISGETKVTTIGESKACTETVGFGTILVEEKLCTRMEDEMSFQQSVGLSESSASGEKISDKTNVTMMGESETCVETDISRTEGAEGKPCNRMEDKMDSHDDFGLSESDTNGKNICDETNVVTECENIACCQMNENKCKEVESDVKQGSRDASHSAGVLFNEHEKPCDPVPDGGNVGEVYHMSAAGADKTCVTKVNLTSTANGFQTSTANLSEGLQSQNTNEVNCSANSGNIAATRVVVIKSKNDLTVSKPSGTAFNKTFRPVAKLLHDTGLDLVTEWVCQDLIHIQTHSTAMSPLPEAEKKRQLSVLASNKKRLTKKNKAFAFRKRQCKCGFLSESLNVLAFHSQFGEVSRNGDMRCCLCSFTARIPRCFNRHLKRRHKLKALVIVKVAQYQCHFCPFENNHQIRIESHLAKCGRLFDLNFNLSPVRMDCDIPVFVSPDALLTGDVQAMYSTVTSASAPASLVFPTGEPLSRLPLHSSMPSCSLIMQQPQQCTTIPSSVTLSLPLTRFIVTPSMSNVMSRIQLSVVPPKNPAQPGSVVNPAVSPLLPVVAPGHPLALPPATQNSLKTNLIISPSQRGLVLPTNLSQNLSQTRLTIPPLVGKDASQSLWGVPSPVTLVPRGLGSDVLRMQLLAPPQAPNVQFQNSKVSSGAETRFIQMGNQLCTIVQHQGRTVLTPVIFPPPILPFTPSFTLNPRPLSSSRPIASMGKQNSAQLPSTALSSNISGQRDAVGFVKKPTLVKNQLSLTLEICELCDGFVKDRKSLSVHFRNAHKVVTDDLSFVVPSQKCSLCMRSFFTISGLLRHFHLIHARLFASDGKLIKPLERCSLCQNINVANAVEHLSSHHHDTMSMSDEFKHCGICSLHLRDVQSFEKHMLLVHGNLFANRNILLATIAASLQNKTRRVCESNPPHLNGQPNQCSKKPRKACHSCKTCGTIHLTAEELNDHIITNHMHKCSRCQEAFTCLPSLRRHFYAKHSTHREACPLCDQVVQIGRPFIRHMKSQHLKECSVKIERMRSSDACENQAKCGTINSIEQMNSSLNQTSVAVDKGSLKSDEEDLLSKSAKKRKLESDQSFQKECSVKIERMSSSDACGNQAKCGTINSIEQVNSCLNQTSIAVDKGSLLSDEDDQLSKSAKKRKLESDQSESDQSWQK